MTEEIVSPVEGRRRRRGIGCRKKGGMLVGGRRKGDGWRESKCRGREYCGLEGEEERGEEREGGRWRKEESVGWRKGLGGGLLKIKGS